ncbi:MAG: hypothetical protein LRS49_00245, partial [Desulfurococcales archaeon]|nr:hypothetical protein [Desulfurococcales archaeon]
MEVWERARRLIERLSPPLVVMHWDMDGVAAASLVARASGRPGEAGFLTPRFRYAFDKPFLDRARGEARGRRLLAVVDLAVPGGSVDLLHRYTGRPAVVVDHHTQPEPPRLPSVAYVNPAARGDPAGNWPSAAHVVASLTGVGDPLLVAASIVGDLGPAARANRWYQNYMVRAGLHPVEDYWLPAECASLVDAASAMGRADVLEALAARLAGAEEPCRLILQDGLLQALRVEAQEELERLLSRAEGLAEEPVPGVLLYRLEGRGRHASKLARELARRHPDRVVVVAYRSAATG